MVSLAAFKQHTCEKKPKNLLIVDTNLRDTNWSWINVSCKLEKYILAIRAINFWNNKQKDIKKEKNKQLLG